MSYISGLAMGASIGNALYQMATGGGGSFVGMGRGMGRGMNMNMGGERRNVRRETTEPMEPTCQLVAKNPGRRRLRVRYLSRELAKFIEEKFSALSFIEEVHANPITGSILIRYNCPDAQMDDIIAKMAERVFSITPPGKITTLKDAAVGEVTKSIHHTVDFFNEWIKQNTGGWFDLRSLVSLAFLCRGFSKAITNRQMPNGPQMIWWAVSLLRGRQLV